MILQHAPARKVYDGFDQYPMGALEREIQILELLAERPVVALTINHEAMNEAEVRTTVADYEQRYDRPTTDVLLDGCDKLVAVIQQMLTSKY